MNTNFSDFTIDDLNNIYVVGTAMNATEFCETTYNPLSATDLVVAKFLPDGNCDWVKGYPGDFSSGQIRFVNDKLIFTAEFNESVNLDGIELVVGTPLPPNEENFNGSLIAQMDLNGNIEWAKKVWVDEYMSSYQLAVNDQSGLWLVERDSTSSLYAEDFEVPDYENSSDYSFVLLKFDLDGNLSLVDNFEGTHNGNFVIEPAGDSFYLSFNRFGYVDSPCLYSEEDLDAMLLFQINSSGVCNSVFTYDNSGEGGLIIADMDTAADGSLYVGGSFGGTQTLATTMFNAGSSDAYLARMSYPIAVEEFSETADGMILMNPTYDYLTGWINTEKIHTPFTLNIFDYSGKLAATFVLQSKSFSVAINSLASGLYFAEVFNENKVIRQRFAVN
ncbi:MAG: T9SS type A sorting domain-containing protein [Flavobacteriales bacterium]|nr:T9SS type A sorting domain-containing protein [Flavobacteriales bacterium]